MYRILQDNTVIIIIWNFSDVIIIAWSYMVRMVTGNFAARSLSARMFGRGKSHCATVSPPDVSRRSVLLH